MKHKIQDLKFKVFLFVTVFAIHFSLATAFAAHPLITDDTGMQSRGKFHLEVNGITVKY